MKVKKTLSRNVTIKLKQIVEECPPEIFVKPYMSNN